MRFQLRDARLAFPNLFEPYKGSYGARLILPPDHSQVIRNKPYLKDGKIVAPSDREAIVKYGIALPPDKNAKIKTVPLLKKIALAIAREKWQAKGDAIFKALEAQDKVFLHDGNTKSEYDGFEGNMFVAANSKTRPSTFDQMRNVVGEGDGVIYSGCFVVASLDFWPQDHKEHGKRINSGLSGIQKLRDGDAFSGGGKAAEADDFDEIGVESGEESGEESSDDDLTA